MSTTSSRAAIAIQLAVVAAMCVGQTDLAATADPPAATVSFRHEVAPLLVRRCLECHSGESVEGGLALDTPEGLAAGGDSGPVISDATATASLLWKRVDAEEMPPEHPLSA